MAGSSSKDLIYRILSTAEGDGFKKTTEDAEKAKTKLDELGEKVDEENHKEVTIRIRVEDEDEDKLKDTARDADSAGNEFGGLSGKMALMAVGVAAVAPALAALPAAFAGVAAGAGVMALGLGGVMKAVQDYGQAVNAPGISGAQMAATMFSNAVAIKNAQLAITQARQQANAQAANSADSLTQAEERLRDAENTAMYAEQDLTRARLDASRALIQTNEAAATANLDVKAAQLALQEAQRQQILTDNSLTATALDKAKAQLEVERAQNTLTNTTEKAKEATQDAAKANQQGVEGSLTVVQAKRAEQSATQGVGDAQRQLTATQRQNAEQRLTSAQQIAKSEQNLTDTQKQQQLQLAATQAQAASQMAQFGRDMSKLTPVMQEVANTIIGMRGEFDHLRATAQNAIGPGVLVFLSGVRDMGPTANTALQQMGLAIGGIFVQLGNLMKSPVFQQNLGIVFKDAAGFVAQFGQGFTQMVNGIVTAGAHASPIVAALGGGFKDLMGSGIPAFFQGLTVNAAGAGQTLGGIVSIVSGLLGPLGTLAGAISGALGPGFKMLAPIITQVANQVVSALLPYMPQLSQAFIAIAEAVGQVAPLLAPLIGIMAAQFVQTLQIVVPLIGQLADFFNQNQKWLIPLVGAIITLVSTIRTLTMVVEIAKGVMLAFNMVMETNPIILIISAIAGLAAGVIYAWNHFSGFRDFIKQAWADIEQWFDDALNWITKTGKQIGDVFVGIWHAIDGAWHQVRGSFDFFLSFIEQWWPELLAFVTFGLSEVIGHWNTIITFISGLGTKLASAAVHMWDWISGTFDSAYQAVVNKVDGVVTFVAGLPGRLATAGVHMWDWVSSEFKTAINAIIGWWDSLNFTTPSFHIPGTSIDVGGVTIGMPQIPYLAAGGTAVEGGLAWVGEKGPELIQMQPGARVISNPDARAMVGASQQQQLPDRFTAELNLKLNGQKIDQILVEFQRQGGTLQSVQNGALRALGTAPR